jgi:hypothetical protein
MTRQLVPIRDDPTDQGGKTLRYPSEGEESSLYLGALELLENPVGIEINPPRKRIPIRTVDTMGEPLDLEIVLYINGHGVG